MVGIDINDNKNIARFNFLIRLSLIVDFICESVIKCFIAPDTMYLTEKSAVFELALFKFRYLSYNGRVIKV